MILFAFYAGLVWYGAVKRRREVMGFVYTLLGVLGVVFIGYLHYRLSIWTNGAICLPVLQSLLYPFGGLLLVVGVYLACLPPKYSGSRCRGCGYDLRGLETDDRVCPECGTRHVLFHGAGLPCRGCDAPLRSRGFDQALCHRCGTMHLMIGRSRQDEPEFEREEHLRRFDEAPEPRQRRSMQDRLRTWLASRPPEQGAQQKDEGRNAQDHQGADQLELRL